MSETFAIEASQLKKNFGEFEAVKGIDFKIRSGECFGFLGPNGAGKTSTMRMIYCFSPLSGGRLRVLNFEVPKDGRRIKARLGVVPQEDNLDPDLTVRQNLLLYATYFDIAKEEAARRSDELLAFLSLREKSHQKLDSLSGGMRRRLLIARALINQPEILILDEPTTGLDPQARHLIWQKLRALKTSGVTMVLTTHYMEEAQSLCDRIVIMDNGKFLTEGRPKDLVEKYVGKEILEIRGQDSVLRDLQRQIENDSRFSEPTRGRSSTDLVADTLYVRLPGSPLKPLEVFPKIQEMDFHLRHASLEDVFLHLTGRELRD